MLVYTYKQADPNSQFIKTEAIKPVGVQADLDLTLMDREWFLNNPSTHCPRHEIPSQGQVSVSPFVNDYTFRSMADHVMDRSTNPPGAHWRPEDVKPGASGCICLTEGKHKLMSSRRLRSLRQQRLVV